MGDTLVIQRLEASCRLGVYEWEQATPQPVWIDLRIAIDAASAAGRDDVSDTLDYGALVMRVKQHVEQRPVRLLETVAESVAALVLKEFMTREVTVRVTKRALPGIESAAVEITRPSDRSRRP